MAEGGKPLDQETQRVIRLLQQAAGQCRALMLNPPGRSDSARSWASSQAAQKLAQIERQLVALNAKVAAFTKIKAEKAYREALAAGDRYADRAGFRQGPLQGTTTLVDPARAGVLSRREGQQLGQIINETTSDISKAVRSTIENTRAVTRKIQALGVNKAELDRLLAGGTIIGQPQQTLRELKALLTKHAIEGKVVTVNTKTGVVMEFKIDTYAELVFQTKLAEATNIATLERLAARGCYYVKIIGSNSVRFCTAYVGKVFYFGPGQDPLGRYPHINQLPRGGAPFHPRCTKQYVAFNPKLATPKQMDEAMPDARLRSMLGKDSTEAQQAFASYVPPAKPVSPEEAASRAADDAPVVVVARKPRQLGEAIVPPTPADFITGAEDFITDAEAGKVLRPTGVARVTVGTNEKLADIVVPPLARSIGRVGVAPASVVFDEKLFVSARKSMTSPLGFDAPTRRLSINPAWPNWERLAEHTAEMHRRKVWSSNDPDHIFLHDLAHLLSVDREPASYAGWRSASFSADEAKRIARELSAQASGNQLEFIAEVVAARKAGRPLPAWVNALYASIGGPS